MHRLVSLFLPPLICASAGFCLFWFWPASEKDPPAQKPAPSTALERPPWQGLQGASRLTACLENVASIEAEEWPAVFARHGQDELLRGALIEGWSAADPAGFWKWIVQQKDASLISEAGPSLFAAWAKRDAASAFAATGSIASHHLRDPLRSLVVQAELARDLKSGLALAAQFGPLFTNAHVDRSWMEKDPLAAVQGLTALPGGRGSFRRFHLSAAVSILSKRNPEAFLTWLESKPRDIEFIVDKENFTEGGPMDAARAIAALSSLKPGNERNEAIRGAIIIGGAQLSAEEIIRLAGQHLNGWERNNAIGEAAEIAAKTDLPKAAALISAMPAGRYVIYSARDVAAGWAEQDWNAAREWVQSIPDSPVRREAWKSVSAFLPPERVPEFAASIATLPREELSDDLLLHTRRAVSKTGPEAVANWLKTLPPDRAAWVESMNRIQ